MPLMAGAGFRSRTCGGPPSLDALDLKSLDTEKVLHGGAAYTARKWPLRARVSRSLKTSSRDMSSLAPPCFGSLSRSTTSRPCCLR